MGMITDPIGDALTRIRNAQSAGHAKVALRASRMIERVVEVLKSEGFIESFGSAESAPGKPSIEVKLKYYPDGRPMFTASRRVSAPGRRTYSGSETLSKVNRGLGILILSTSQGVMSDRKARKLKIGGEVLASIG